MTQVFHLATFFICRWILLCFKREFPECDALRIWEACWSHYQTDYFHLFLCVAIVSIYGDDVIEQNLPADEILLHFSSLAMHMNGDLVLRKVRQLMMKSGIREEMLQLALGLFLFKRVTSVDSRLFLRINIHNIAQSVWLGKGVVIGRSLKLNL